MAITKLNSLAIPDDTIVEADLSYPLTNFSSTGIDDNATSTAITIDSGEDVGVKETNPQRALHVNSAASNVVARFESTDATAVLELKDDSGTAEIGCTGNDVVIAPAGVEKARVTTGGYLGVNNPSPSESVSIIGTGGTAKIRFDGDSSNLQNNFIGITGYDDLIIASDEANSGTASTIQFRVDATTRFYMNSAGHTTLIGSGSTDNNNTAEVLSVTGSNHVRHMISTSATNGSQASLALESNSATVAIATTGSDEMRFTTNGAEQLRINGAGNVLIGTDNGWFSASGRRILRVQGGSNGSFLVLDTSGSGDFYIETANSGRVSHWNQANESMIFGTNNTERMRILASGGLTFNGDTAAANALDDYEEGTWEPALIGLSSNPSVTYHADTGGFYIKIGRLVYVTGTVRTTAISGGSGELLIANLPFSISDRTNGDNSDGVGTANTNIWNGTSAKHPTFVRCKRNDSAFFIGQNSHDAVSTLLSVGDWGSACMMSFTIVYYH